MADRISIYRASTEMGAISRGVGMSFAMDVDARHPRGLPNFVNDLLGGNEKNHG